MFKKDEFYISPQKGHLKPLDKIMITFTLTQEGYPTYLEGELNCRILWD